MKDKIEPIARDLLAIERTKLANERTFLAYFRTGLVFMGTGLTILKVQFFSDIKFLGILFIILSPIIITIGILRLAHVKKLIRTFYN